MNHGRIFIRSVKIMSVIVYFADKNPSIKQISPHKINGTGPESSKSSNGVVRRL